ncbi:MAG TPA: hypothetical protein VFK86_17630 [Bauldia sp.]|nr:hypothetical protein [Bauldia sp.]
MGRIIMIAVVSVALSPILEFAPPAMAQGCPGVVVATGGSVSGRNCATACVGASARANANARVLCPRHCELGRATTIGRDCRKVQRGHRCFVTHSYPCT